MNKEELERLRIAYEFEVSLYEGKGEVITFEQWLREKGEDVWLKYRYRLLPTISEDNADYPSSREVKGIVFVDTDKVNSINLDKPSLNRIGMCTLKIGTDTRGGDVTMVAHINFEKE